MFKPRFLPTLMAIGLAIFIRQAANAQGTTTLRDPLVPGTQSTLPLIPPAPGPIPPPGAGPTPTPVTPGMLGAPTPPDWVLNYPANDRDLSTSGIPLPVPSTVTLPPGTLGTILTPFLPSSPSMTGPAPAYLQAPPGFVNPAQLTTAPASGIYPGTGGYNTTISNIPRGGQVTQQLNQQGLPTSIGSPGQKIIPGVPNQGMGPLSQFGQLAGNGLPNGVPTGAGYNNGPAGTNNDNYLYSIDLGGGLDSKIAGTVVSFGKTIQQYGGSAFYNNAIGALNANQSTDFGQGIQGSGMAYNAVTDYGNNVQGPGNPLNVPINGANYALPKTAIETNF